jgi:glycosyltransferase involved in cell wall biosynthesis
MDDSIKDISIYCSIYDTNPLYFEETLNSLKSQIDILECELIVIDDGSSDENTELYQVLLNNLKEECTFVKKIIYKKLEKNQGVGYSANIAVLLCNYEIVFRMDTDDIMSPTRIQQQYNFIIKHPKCMLCSGDIREFQVINNNIKLLQKTNHPEIITWNIFKEEYRKTTNMWFYNGPLFCFRRSAVLSVGNYNKNLRFGEDGELFVRILKKYGFVYNLKVLPVLLLYRLHNNNLSKSSKKSEYETILHSYIRKYI